MKRGYTLKLDDDIFVNIFNLVAHLSTLYKRDIGRTNTVLCLVWYKMRVQRDDRSKWFARGSSTWGAWILYALADFFVMWFIRRV
jgi:hypothetical protein